MSQEALKSNRLTSKGVICTKKWMSADNVTVSDSNKF